MNDFADKIRSSGKRLTAQRELILRAVDHLGHGTPDEIHAEVHKHSTAVNLSTVYRNLEVLEELGLVRHTHLSDRAPTYHSVTDHEHFHMVCRNCEKVTSLDPAMLSDFVARLREEHGFEPDIGHLAVFGHCLDCVSASPPAQPDNATTPHGPDH
ncbi:Fur family ferric uptake transcriptional regulator [Nocardioides daedukensis]|uniref:Fur family ferric uptake transcriptional regulator n=1 Tax=Nocardioides daedukensis TaxID=634462 RepID=A0A7Y9S204_9ACTN|nr:transcriptional repressor [Nocardioides daedukensis]NYG59791.1 Fur family ferric uptake transcriptional regulator [Nocardioides daedukensis]